MKTNMIHLILVFLILGACNSLPSKKTPIPDALYQWHFTADEKLVASGSVKTGVRFPWRTVAMVLLLNSPVVG